MLEIERKFLLKTPPPLREDHAQTRVQQGYLPCGLRLRRGGEETILNMKGEGGLVRLEWETPVPPWVQKRLWAATEGKRVEKTRHLIPYGVHTLEVDQFHGAHKGLWLLECEFDSREQAEAFTLPEWAKDAEEVTEDPHYYNANLAG